jgi:type I restriction enzyme S subunit
MERLGAFYARQAPSRRLEELCAAGAPITYGILQPGPDLDEGVPYVRPSEIKNSQVDLNRLKKTSPEIARKYSKSELKSGDILLTIVGTIGETAVVPPELEGGNITQSSARIRVNPRLASPAFIYHFLKSQHAKRQIDRDRLGVAVERLNLHHVRDMEILCPPLEIQEKFAAEAQSMANIAYRHSLLACSASSLFNSLSNSLFAGNQGQ